MRQVAPVRTRRRREMVLIIASGVERPPLREARLTLDMSGYEYTGWFVRYNLAKSDAILGKGWIEEVPHHVDLTKNIL